MPPKMRTQLLSQFVSFALSKRSFSTNFKDVPSSRANFESLSSYYERMIVFGTLNRRDAWIKKTTSTLAYDDGVRLLDLAGGQGVLTFAFLEEAKRRGASRCVSYVCDISERMMALGRSKACALGHGNEVAQWVHGDVHNLPFEDNVFDACVLFFGIRKIDLEQVCGEVHRVLKPGGKFVVFDMAVPKNRIVNWLFWDVYTTRLMPIILKTFQKDISDYLSVQKDLKVIPKREEIVSMFERTKFGTIKCTDVDFGIATYFEGSKLY